jgi:hypothetical protein
MDCHSLHLEPGRPSGALSDVGADETTTGVTEAVPAVCRWQPTR